MKTVALVDHFVFGHHLAFIKLFSKYLLKCGYRVCIFYPEKENEIKQYLIHEGNDANHINFYPIDLQKKKVRFLGSFNHAAATWLLWLETKKAIKKAEHQFDIKVDLVFFAWLDDHLANGLPHQLVDIVFPYRWSGLYFHPWYLYENVGKRISFSSIDSVLRSKNCVSVGIHDEFVREKLAERISKKVVLFPEIADSTPPDENFELAVELKKKANGRKVVGLVGILKSKGFLTFMQLVQQANPQKFFFFTAGNMNIHDFNEAEEKMVRSFLSDKLPEHCFYYPGSIREGAFINAIINALDVIFIVYNNFRSSSNYNTKAALFRKQVLATNRFWIGEVTSKYGMGEVVEEGNVSEALAALEKLHRKIEGKQLDFKKYELYLQAHGEHVLLQTFKEAL
jgi:hypothetical protein